MDSQTAAKVEYLHHTHNWRYVLRFKRNTKLTLVFWGCATSFFLAALAAYPPEAESGTVEATWYNLEGNTTASGETFHGQALTAAHPTAPFGTLLRVCYQDCTTVRVNDRPDANTSLDLSEAAAERVGLKDAGRAAVTVEQSSSTPITKLPDTSGAKP